MPQLEDPDGFKSGQSKKMPKVGKDKSKMGLQSHQRRCRMSCTWKERLPENILKYEKNLARGCDL